MAFNPDEDLLIDPDFWFNKVERYDESIHIGSVEESHAERLMRRYIEEGFPRVKLSEDSAEDRLMKIKDLYDRGIITEDEYAAKRTEIIASL